MTPTTASATARPTVTMRGGFGMESHGPMMCLTAALAARRGCAGLAGMVMRRDGRTRSSAGSASAGGQAHARRPGRRNPPIPRGSRSRASADRRSRASWRPVPARWRNASRAARPEGRDELRLGGLAEGFQARPRGSRPHRGEVHGRGEVLSADVAERVTADGVARERAERARGSARVERSRLLGVVDEHDDAPCEVARRAGEPAVERKADLGHLAIRESSPFAAAVRRGPASSPRPRAARRPRRSCGDQQLPDAAGTADHPVDRQRIEHLVGDDARRSRPRVPPSRAARSPAAISRARRASSLAGSTSTGR